jgi:hypothetical protein
MRRIGLTVALALLSVFWLFGCSDGTSPADTISLCDDSSDCPLGYWCNDGICTLGIGTCSDTQPCPSGLECINGTCVIVGTDGGMDGDGGADGDGGSDGGEQVGGPDIEVVFPQPSGGVYQINFGSVSVGVAVEEEIVIENIGDEDLRIMELNFEAGTDWEDFSIAQSVMGSLPLVVLPGEQTRIPVTYTASDGVTDHAILDVISNDPDEALVQIHLLSEFKGEARVEVSQTALAFGDIPVGDSSQPLSFAISNQGTGNAVLTVEDVRLGIAANPDFEFEVLDAAQQPVAFPALLNIGDAFDVLVTYHPQQHEEDSDKVIVVTDDAASPTLEVALTGRGVVGDVSVEPSPVNLGRVRVGQSGQLSVTITNAGGAPLSLTGVQLADTGAEWTLSSTELDLADLANNPHELQASEAVHVDVGFAPADVGVETGRLVIDHTGPSSTVETGLSAEGYIPPHVTTDPDPPALVFQDVQWDQPTSTAESRSLSITIGNDGGESLMVSNMHLQNDSPQFTWDPNIQSIVPTQQVLLQVTFTPTASGQVLDKLLLDTNDPDIEHDGVTGRLAIDLQANAIDPAILVTPVGSHDFGDVSIGNRSVLQVTILSASPDPLWILDIRLGAGGSSDYRLDNLPNLSNPLIGQGTFVTFDVLYEPTDSGSDPGAVEIESSDIGNPLVTITLSGSSPGCPAGYGDCDAGVPGCETPLNTLQDCGACGIPCDLPHATETCENYACEIVSCEGAWGDCDPVAPGCETDTSTSIEHCLGCGNACSYPHAQAVCGAAGCEMGACLDDYWDLDGSDANGCEYHCVFRARTIPIRHSWTPTATGWTGMHPGRSSSRPTTGPTPGQEPGRNRSGPFPPASHWPRATTRTTCWWRVARTTARPQSPWSTASPSTVATTRRTGREARATWPRLSLAHRRRFRPAASPRPQSWTCW